MDKIIKERWLNALKSGKYNHGVGLLHNLRHNRHCCLGVLCEVLKEENKVQGIEGGIGIDKQKCQYFKSKIEEVSSATYLTPEIKKLCEISREDENILTKINDSALDYSRQIKYIEKYL